MSNLFLELDDVYSAYQRDSATANKITKTEVLNKINYTCIQCEAIESYLRCFEREWGFPTQYYIESLNTALGTLRSIESYFRMEVPNDLSSINTHRKKAI